MMTLQFAFMHSLAGTSIGLKLCHDIDLMRANLVQRTWMALVHCSDMFVNF